MRTPSIVRGSVVSLLLMLPAIARSERERDDHVALSLTEFEGRAIEQGVQGREAELNYESQGYTRDILFRRTDSPTLTAGHTETRTGTRVNNAKSQTDIKDTTLKLSQPTPVGTTLSGTASYGDRDQPGFQASANQPLYVFTHSPELIGRRRADLNFASARDTRDATILSVRSHARSAYYNVLLAEQSIEVEQRKVTAARKLLEITQALVDAGRLAPVETMRAKIRLQEDDRQLQNATVSRLKAVADAKNLILYPPDEPLEFSTALQFKPLTLLPQRLVDYALLHRPEIRELRRSQELADLDLRLAGDPTLPTLGLNSTYNYTHLPGLVSSGWTVGWSAGWTFFDSFVTSKRVRQSRIAKVIADLNLANGERTTRVDVQNAYLDIKRAERQIRDFEFSREQARRNVEVLRLRFQNGLERIIDVFDAENDMRNIENEYLSVLVQFNTSKDNLSQLVGADVETL